MEWAFSWPLPGHYYGLERVDIRLQWVGSGNVDFYTLPARSLA